MEFEEYGIGGIRVSGYAGRFYVYNPTPVSGSLVGGTGVLTYPTLVADGGVLVGGDAIDSIADNGTGTGGIVLGSSAVVSQSVYNYPNTTDPIAPIVVEGDASYSLTFNYFPDGHLFVIGGEAETKLIYTYNSTGLSDNKPPEYAGVSVGYVNDQNPTEVSVVYRNVYNFSWNTNAYVSNNYTFLWNVGRLRSYWYRVLGKEKPDACGPIFMDDGCCRTYVMNVQARTIGDICAQLKTLGWKWPIEQILKFSKPAEQSAIDEDAANGITYDCNTVEEVDICSNPLCIDFCVDYDLDNANDMQQWGFSASVQVDAFEAYQGSGSVVLSGSAGASFSEYIFELDYQGSGIVTTGGEAVVASSDMSYEGDGEVVVSGVAGVASTLWSYAGGIWPYVEGPGTGDSVSQFALFANDNSWSNPTNVLTDDNQEATVDLSLGKFSKALVIRNLGFEIPTDKKILGFKVNIKRFANSGVRDYEIYLANYDGSTYNILSDNKAKATNWPILFETTATYGGVFDDWRLSTSPGYLGQWDINDINDPNFVLVVRARPTGGAPSVYAAIQYIDITVYYEEEQHQSIRMGGEAGVVSSKYTYRGTGGIQMSGSYDKFTISQTYKALGRGDQGPSFAGVTMGGTYGLHFNYTGDGEVIVGGAADAIKSYWEYESEGGEILMGGEAGTVSSNYHYYPDGSDITTSGSARLRARYNYNASGSAVVDGEAGQTQSFTFLPDGDIVEVAGEAAIVSSAWSWFGDGVVTVSGSADLDIVDPDPAALGFEATVEDLQVQYTTTPDNTTTATPTLGNVLACQCSSMPFKLTFGTNLFRGNKLNQFVVRNTIALPRIFSMYYNTIYGAWQHNNSFNGFGDNGVVRDRWNLVFTLGCTTSLGGQEIGQKIWLFSATITQTNLQTYADQDSHISIAFLPTGICDSQNNLFKVNLAIDVTKNQTISTPSTTIYQSVFYDNIGLFKDKTWMTNPILNFTLSQIGIPTELGSIPLVV